MAGLDGGLDRLREHVARPRLLLLAGPSGAGKSSLIRDLLGRRGDFVVSVSATTRPPRAGEVDGRDYFFLDEEAFEARVEAGAFLEYARVFGRHRYGTPRQFIEERFAEGLNVIADVDVQGADQIAERAPSAVRIFVCPPTAEDLGERLRRRGTESDDVLRERLDTAAEELRRWPEFDYVLINDDLVRAGERLAAIAAASCCALLRSGGLRC